MSETDEMLAYLVAIHEESGREVDEETYALLSDDVLEDARAKLRQTTVIEATARELAKTNPELAARLRQRDAELEAGVAELNRCIENWNPPPRKPAKAE
jgi:hypothetical protein